MSSFKEYQERLEEAERLKTLWLNAYIKVYDLVLPSRDDRNIFNDYIMDNKDRNLMIYDATAELAAIDRANELQGLIIPQDKDWGKFKINPLFTDDIKIQQTDLDIVNKTIRDYIISSDLQIAAQGAFLDLNLGTGAFWIDTISDEEPFSFKAISNLSLFIEFNTDNVLKTAWIKKAMTGRQILSEWPKYNGPQKIALEKEPNRTFFVWIGHVEIERNKKFYVYGVLDEDKLTPLFQEENTYQRLIIFREKVRSGEVQGRGIAIDLYPNIYDLNQICKSDLKYVGNMAEPITFYDVGANFNPYSLVSQNGAYVPMVNDRPPLRTMEYPQMPKVTDKINDLREFIKVGFQVEPLGDLNTAVRSATEVNIRENRNQRARGTEIVRLINECPKPIFITIAKILYSKQLLGNKVNVNDPRLMFEYSSPLLDLRRLENVQALEQFSQYVQQNFGEGANLAAFNFDKLLPFLTENFNLDPQILNSSEAIQNAMSAIVQASQNQPVPQATTGAAVPSPVVAPQTLV